MGWLINIQVLSHKVPQIANKCQTYPGPVLKPIVFFYISSYNADQSRYYSDKYKKSCS